MSSSPTSSSSTDAALRPFSGLLDVLCTVDVIVGSGSISVRDCLKLQRDSVIRLAQAAGSDLQVSVNGIAAATGEVVVDDDTTSLRISQVMITPDAEARA
jgi:flagellar motor switch protein FliN/FliY